MFNKMAQQNGSTKVVNFCRRWLELVAVLHILGGLSLCFDWPELLWSEYRNELFHVFSSVDKVNDNLQRMVEMLTQLFGPTVASWGILMFHLVRRITDRGAIDILILATLFWFVLDSAISMKFGMILHLIINSIAAIAILLPLIYLRLKLSIKGDRDYANYRIES